MKYLPLVWAGLYRNRVRTVLTFLCVVVAFVLLGTLRGITAGLAATIESLSDARLRVLNRTNLTQPLPLSYLTRIEKIAGVRRVSYATSLGGYYQDPKNAVVSSALDLRALLDIYPEIQLPAPQRAMVESTRTGAIVGIELARRFGWKVGDRVPLHSRFWTARDGSNVWTFDVVGIYRVKNEAIAANGLYASYDYLDEGRTTSKGTVNQFIVSIDNAAIGDRVSQEIDETFANSADQTYTQSEKTYLRLRLAQIGDIGFFVDAVAAAMLFLLLCLTINTMMLSVRQRIPEFAALRSIGYGGMKVMTIVVAEALVLCVTAAVTGLASAAVAFPFVLRDLGFGIVPLPLSVVAAGIVLTLALAIIGSAPPLWRLSRMSISSALRRA